MKQGYSLVTIFCGSVEDVIVFEREEDAKSLLFDSLKEQIQKDKGKRHAYEIYQKDEPTGKFAQFFEGIDTDDIGLTLDAYTWLLDTAMADDTELRIFPCEIHEPKIPSYFH